ncbi:type II toxin-antitoxin system HipA family toxin [Hydrogenimonas sp.]
MATKKELIVKYIDYIETEHRKGKTLMEISETLADEFSIDVSTSYISQLLKRAKRSKKRRVEKGYVPQTGKGKSDNPLLVELFRNNRKIGTLAKVGEDHYMFAYESGIPDHERFVADGLHHSIPPQIENLLPEGVNRERLAHKHGLDPKESFELLKYLDDAHGGYSSQPVTKRALRPFDHTARRYEETIVDIDTIEVDPDTRQAIEDIYLTGGSRIVNRLSHLSGQQPKTVVSLYRNRLYLPSESEYSNAILKVCNREYRNINIIENMLLSLARFKLGIATERTVVLIDAEKRSDKPDFLKDRKDHFLTSRYDRDTNGPKMAYELLSLIGKPSTLKYEVSLEEIFSTVQRRVDSRSLEELARYYYFSYLAGNGDAHAKNIAFFKREDDSFEIAPLYDVVNTVIYRIEGSLGVPLHNRGEIGHDELFSFLSRYADSDRLHRIRRRFFEHIYDYLDISREIMDIEIYQKLEEFYRQKERECKG